MTRFALLISLIGLVASSCEKGGALRFGGASFNETIASAREEFVNANDAQSIDRKVILTGSIEFETTDIEKTKTELQAYAKEVGGYVSGERQNTYSGRLAYTMLLRIPTAKFSECFQKIEGMAVRVEEKSTNSQDVTEDYIDVSARLKTKQELEARYRELLKQARTIEDMVSIEAQLGNVRSEIESLQGRMNYLNDQVSLSTINASFFTAGKTDFGFGFKFRQSFSTGWGNLLGFLIFLFEVWPFVILVTVGAILFVRRRRRLRDRKPS